MNLYEKTRETAVVPQFETWRDGWDRWPSVKSLTCLIFKFSLASLLAALVLAIPVGIVALIIAYGGGTR